ncbi:type II secretion system ATPase GspE [Dasania sp. GY-MA-18]|uniref:Type II secretion system protein E n=1 Tax=Dasania phycosphaerae TaxID=2950436 RepID=A0A9J6RHS4_9GAMM|nr:MULTISPECIES: type II secretion system ATPase GspE [Dasania]MCR8921794.1 type II secretion system ATPase GspE [Dasania sp. GY-MA-18]MCZ0864222.1 type II secretion system ATPase GspE [Dasania phycosphaerae]MCZ0867950.1 type II secretion system ATPase GspE [Dasania phycosphaerae]
MADQNSAFQNIPFAYAKKNAVFVKAGAGQQAQVCHKNPLPLMVYAELRRYFGGSFQSTLLNSADFDQQLAAAYERDSSEAMQMVENLGDEIDLASIADAVPEAEDLLEQEGDAPIIRLINAVLAEAVKENASDIHIESFEKRLVIRFRIDGVLREAVEPKRELAPLLVSRLKVMAKLDIAEKRIPQDGRISLRVGGREIDVRVSTMPSSNGERVVLRLLDKQAGRLNLKSLGMPKYLHKNTAHLLRKPHGIILVTGPTGSGKTTTLYAGLAEINDASRNILTVEDPIEYNLEGIGQTQVNVKADMTFARGLRAMLRQDPDVVMVGEIRDLETAEIAVQASLTGHLVLSTLHTNTAVGAITRLRDMGIESFLLASSLVGVISQRLVRVLCPHCKQQQQPSVLEREFLGELLTPDTILYAPVGCDECNHLGYSGRQGIYELLVVDEALRELIHADANESELIKQLRQHSPSIRSDGRQRVLAGITTVEEVIRVTHEE